MAPYVAPLFNLSQSELQPLDSECYTHSSGLDYAGHIKVTRQGHTCQSWSTQAPHIHDFTELAYPHARLGAHNSCRNPGGAQQGPWCFTTAPGTRWGLCDVGAPRPSCPQRVLLDGNASLGDGALQLTTGERLSLIHI